METSRHPSNQVASYSPISFGVYEDIKKSLSAEYSLSLYDGYTMLMQQEQNAVGKKVIGIAATGLKNYFGLVKYYNDYYEKASNSNEGLKLTDNAYFLRQFTLVDAETGKPKQYTINKIAGINLNEKANAILKSTLLETLKSASYETKDGNKLSEEDINKIVDNLITLDKDAALDISSILSLATDNAKELMLAKINAGIDFAGMHIYLAILGIDTEVVAKYMTSPEALAIKKGLSRDFFTEDKFPSVIVKLSQLQSKDYLEYKKKLNEKLATKRALVEQKDIDNIDKSIKKLNED